MTALLKLVSRYMDESRLSHFSDSLKRFDQTFNTSWQRRIGVFLMASLCNNSVAFSEFQLTGLFAAFRGVSTMVDCIHKR